MRVLSAVLLTGIRRAFLGQCILVFPLKLMAGFGASSDPCMLFCMSTMRCCFEISDLSLLLETFDFIKHKASSQGMLPTL